MCEAPAVIKNADKIILPGVGSYRLAIENLRVSGLDKAILEAVQVKKRSILGICLGMQLMAEIGMEDGESRGLSFFPGKVCRFAPNELGILKLPHTGFNTVRASKKGNLFKNFNQSADFYFVHSYRVLPFKGPGYQALCRYGIEFVAAYEHENLYAVQFHPEKSQTNGLILLKNFLET